MISLARLSLRRPKSALTAFLIAGVALSLIGFGAANTTSPSVQVVRGTESSRAQALATAQFGPSQLVPILLEGPKALLNHQGPALARALARRPHTRVLSPWDAGTASAGLRPKPTAATILVAVDRSEKDAVRYDQPQIESLVARKISAPVRSFITGQPSIDRAEQQAALSNLRTDALIGLAVVFALLLAGLGAPVAAALLTAVAALSTFAALGAVALLGHVLTLDPVGTAAGTMIGLALAVGFGLLILRSFQDGQLAASDGALRVLRTTGRRVVFAAALLPVALLLVAIIGPAEVMSSVGTGLLVCALFAIGGAVVLLPAALALLGPRIDALRVPGLPVPARVPGRSTWTTRRAVSAGLIATMLLGTLAVPAAALSTGPEDVSQLPAGSKARTSFDQVSKVMGAGWATPYTVTLASNHGPITKPALLAAIYRFEQRIMRNKAVASLTGPGQVYATATQLQSFGPQLRHSVTVSDQSKRNLLKLIDGLGQAGAGSAQLQAGLASASSGAGQLHGGSTQAGSGAGQLHTGLAQAQAGSAKLQAGLGSALNGAVALESGSAKALSGSRRLVAGLAQAQAAAKPSAPALASLATQTAAASTQVDTALADLQSMTTGKHDPRYATALSALTAASGAAGSSKSLASAVSAQAPALIAGLNQLHTGAAQLQAGIDQLHGGNDQLAGGIRQLSGGGGQLASGLTQLTTGAQALQTGIGQLTGGASQLATGLSGGVGPAGQLTSGLGTMKAAVTKSRAQIPSTAQLKQLEAQSPGIFSSGYFVLAAVDGATQATRNAATFTMNLDRGGTAGQIMVVPKYRLNDPRTLALGRQLDSLSQGFARAHNLQVAVGGPAGNLRDLTNVVKSRLWLDVAAVALAIALVLAVTLRAVLLPAVASVLGLLVAGLTFGVLDLLAGGHSAPLGGPGYLDPITIISVFTLAFGTTAMFSAIVLRRMREAFVAGLTSREAARRGLRGTAAITAAGLLMVATLIPFTAGGLLNLRELGIALAVATLLNILVVRPVLLPAAASVLGRYGWWPTRHRAKGAFASLGLVRRELPSARTASAR